MARLAGRKVKIAAWTAGAVLAALALFVLLPVAASERVEVVRLHTVDPHGDARLTRLWIVDHNGLAYLRGDSDAAWVQRLRNVDRVRLTRNGETGEFRHRLRGDMAPLVNRLMREKYTWGDVLMQALGGNVQAEVVELAPLPPGA